MPTPRLDRARQLAAQLDAAGVPSTADVRELLGRLPAVLVGPPRLAFDTYTGATCTWRLLAVAGAADEHDAWQQLDELVDAVAELLPVETGEPAFYAPSPDSPTRPAYALTLTETVES